VGSRLPSHETVRRATELKAMTAFQGSTYVGGFRPREAHAALKLPDGEEVLAVLPVGHRP